MLLGEYLDIIQAPFPGQLTAVVKSGGTYLYSWSEQSFDPTTGALLPATPGRSGTSALAPAVEVNNQQIPAGSLPCYVWLRLRGIVAGQPWYEFSCPAGVGVGVATSGGGVNLQTSNYTFTAADVGKLVTFSATGAVTGTLTPGSLGATWYTTVENLGTGTLTLSPSSGTIDAAASLALPTNQGCLVYCDGTNCWTSRGRIGLPGGDLAGTYPSPTVAGLQGRPVSNVAPTTSGPFLQWNGSTWAAGAPFSATYYSGHQTTNYGVTTSLAPTGLGLTIAVAGTYRVTVDATAIITNGGTAGLVTVLGYLYQNGAKVNDTQLQIYSSYSAASVGYGGAASCSVPLVCAAGDGVALYASYTASTSPTVLIVGSSTGSSPTRMMAERMA